MTCQGFFLIPVENEFVCIYPRFLGFENTDDMLQPAQGETKVAVYILDPNSIASHSFWSHVKPLQQLQRKPAGQHATEPLRSLIKQRQAAIARIKAGRFRSANLPYSANIVSFLRFLNKIVYSVVSPQRHRLSGTVQQHASQLSHQDNRVFSSSAGD